jgi:conserved repeat domain
MKKKCNAKNNKNVKRKSVVLSGLLIIFLLICTSIAMASTGYSEKNKTLGVQNSAVIQIAGSSKFYQAPKNPDFIKYENSKASSQISMNKQKTGLIPSPMDLRHLSQSAIKTSFPSKYDLRALNKVTPVKDQGNEGNCWAFATYGALESYLKPGENCDFSENNLKNVLSNTAPEGFDFSEGGTTSMSTAYLARWSGTVNEKDDPYSDSSTYSPNELKLPVSKHVQDVLFLPSRQGSLDNDGIKSAIKKYGAVDTGICTGGVNFYDYYSTATHSFYYAESSYSDHAVDIVGWDDNYDKNNFSQVPPGNGAFIVKNSWGTSFGDNGYFYVSYYDSNIGKTNCVFTAENTNNYNSVYQYDPLGWTNTIGCNSPTCWGANVFTAKSNEILKAVSFYATDSDCNYDIYIYTNPTSGPINGTGSVLTQSGTSSTAGYHTVRLTTGVPLKAGQKFSVVIKFTTLNWNSPVAIEQPYDGYSSKARANSSESFVSCDGNTWYDMTSIASNTDVCIKAFTNTNNQNPVLKITKTAAPTTYNTVGQKITYTYTVTNSGNVPVSGIAVKDNKTTVKISSGSLAPGSSVKGTATYTITKADVNAGSVTNSAYATGKFGTKTVNSNKVTATAKVVQKPALKITKTAAPTTYKTVGQKITYTYTVTNSGNVPVSVIAVKDNKATVKISSGTLASGSSVKGTSTYTITKADISAGTLTNSAYATGKFGTKTVTSSQVKVSIKYKK